MDKTASTAMRRLLLQKLKNGEKIEGEALTNELQKYMRTKAIDKERGLAEQYVDMYHRGESGTTLSGFANKVMDKPTIDDAMSHAQKVTKRGGGRDTDAYKRSLGNADTLAGNMVPTANKRTQLVAQPTQATVAQPVVQPTQATAVQPVVQPTQATVAQPVAQPTQATVAQPVVQPTQAPAVQPVAQPTQATVAQPVAQPTQATVAQPVAQPTQATVANQNSQYLWPALLGGTALAGGAYYLGRDQRRSS
jgi:hypothetical protein